MVNAPKEKEENVVVATFDSVVHKLLVPFIAAMALNLFKMTSQQRYPSLNDANDTAIDLVVTSIMSVSELQHPVPLTRERITLILVSDFFALGFLLIRRGVRQKELDAAASAKSQAPDIKFGGVVELMCGVMAATITVL